MLSALSLVSIRDIQPNIECTQTNLPRLNSYVAFENDAGRSLTLKGPN